MKKLTYAAAACLVFNCMWLVLMILSVAKRGSINSLHEAVKSVAKLDLLFHLSYINAIFVTVSAAVFLVFLYSQCSKYDHEWSLAGLVFIPPYLAINLFVYFSQISIVPILQKLAEVECDREMYIELLGMFVQGWQKSAVSVFNQLAYAVMGIPSIIFGVIMVGKKIISQAGGWSLIINGALCIIGAAGLVVQNNMMISATTAGGAVFIIALGAILIESRKSSKVDA
jgi:hypothetical protein